jgi:hypothetical protein
MNHFLLRAIETNDWNEDHISEAQLLDLLNQKINSVSLKSVKEDVRKFIKDDQQLEIWSADYFNDLVAKMKFC